MDVGGWLRRLGLGEYETAFRENNIDDAILPSLTTEDLKELGVGSVGHRRKLLDAIAALRAEACEPAPLSDAPLETDNAVNDTAERRQVTVMFSDLVGSTALSARMDPEDLREVISAYQMCVADTVRRFGGFVARYMGDGVLIYFGYPAAHEDDAERAVRAGLALVDAVATLPAPEPLQVRIGAATGMVVVGDLVGSGKAQEHDIVGETPNLAARLQAIAEPNTVVIAAATRNLLGNLFELRDLGPKQLKGIAGPVGAFAVLRASSVESRFEAMHPGGMTALVGRKEELELLLRRWARARTDEGQVVLLSGEAGIGKSRLSAALMENIAAERHTRLRYFCSPQHSDSAFYPLIGQFERAAGFAHGDTSQMKLDKLDALLAQTSTSRQDAALLAEMLSLPNDGRYPALELVPEQRRQKTLEALDLQLETLARSSPLLMILEDAHWGDPTSLEAFGRTVGFRLGLFDALHRGGPASVSELAKRTGLSERCVREWSLAQASNGYIAFDRNEQRFSLTPEQAMVFAVKDSPVYLEGAFDLAGAMVEGRPKVEAAFQHGNGVAWGESSGCLFCAVGSFFRPGYVNNIVQSWLPALDGMPKKLNDGSRVADIGCGVGFSTLLMAKAFPKSSFIGYDFHGPSIEQANAHAQAHGLADRVRFVTARAKDITERDFDHACTTWEIPRVAPNTCAAC
jgi:class 3 adenylate cyclase